MKVLIADKYPSDRLEELKGLGFDVEYEPTLTDENLPRRIQGASALVVRSTKVTKELFDASDELKIVIRAGAGTNTIDKDTAKERQIAVCNCPGKNSVAVAELDNAAVDPSVLGREVEVRAVKTGPGGAFTYEYPVEDQKGVVEMTLRQEKSVATVQYDLEKQKQIY